MKFMFLKLIHLISNNNFNNFYNSYDITSEATLQHCQWTYQAEYLKDAAGQGSPPPNSDSLKSVFPRPSFPMADHLVTTQ